VLGNEGIQKFIQKSSNPPNLESNTKELEMYPTANEPQPIRRGSGYKLPVKPNWCKPTDHQPYL
jgi:hypothetical protein